MSGVFYFAIIIPHFKIGMMPLLISNVSNSIDKRHGVKEIFKGKSAMNFFLFTIGSPLRNVCDQLRNLFFMKRRNTCFTRFAMFMVEGSFHGFYSWRQ